VKLTATGHELDVLDLFLVGWVLFGEDAVTWTGCVVVATGSEGLWLEGIAALRVLFFEPETLELKFEQGNGVFVFCRH
jgi:hypothetical protein